MSSRIKGALFLIFTVALGFGVLATVAESYDTSDCGRATDKLCQAAARRGLILIVSTAFALWLGALWLMLRNWGKD